MVRVTSIDIGVQHLALVLIEGGARFEILTYDLVDLVKLEHRRVSRDSCKLHHTNHVVDRIHHLIQEFPIYFEGDHIILIERQPPQGLTDVEAVLVTLFRQRCLLLSPNAVHKKMGQRGFTYDERKKMSESIALQYFTREQLEGLGHLSRFHDISDAVLQALYYFRVHKHQRALPLGSPKGILEEHHRVAHSRARARAGRLATEKTLKEAWEHLSAPVVVDM